MKKQYKMETLSLSTPCDILYLIKVCTNLESSFVFTGIHSSPQNFLVLEQPGLTIGECTVIDNRVGNLTEAVLAHTE